MENNITPNRPISSDTFEADYSAMEKDSRSEELKRKLRARLDESKNAVDDTVRDKEEVPAEQPEQDPSSFIDSSLAVGKDIGKGVASGPRSALRGATKGIEEILSIGREITKIQKTPILKFYNDSGEFDPSFLSQKELIDKFGGKDNPTLEEAFKKITPDAPKNESVTGKMIETISQFLVGFKGIDKVFKAAKTASVATKAASGVTTGKVGEAVAKGVLADLAAFDEQDQRLSNLIEEVPALRNPVTNYLKAEEDDSFLEGKMKQALEGAGLGVITEAFVPAIRAMRKVSKLKSSAKNGDDLFQVPAEEAAGIGVDGKSFNFLGDPDSTDLLIKRKIEKSATQSKGIDVDDVTAASKKPLDESSARDYQINFARIDGPDDIKSVMNELVNDERLVSSVDSARRATRPNEVTLNAAEDIDGFNELMTRRSGDAFNAEQIVAARKMYYTTTDKLMEAAKRASDAEATAVDHYNFRRMVAIHHSVQKEFMGVRAEAGRALQAWRIDVGGTSAENLRALEDTLNRFGGADASSELARRLSSMGDEINTSQINLITQKAGLARTVDAMTEIWTLGLLTNPTTHVVNLASNMLTSVALGIERGIASIGDGPVTMRETISYFQGLLQSQKEAIKNSAKAFRTGEVGIGLGKIELPPVRATSREVLDAQGVLKPLGYAMDYYGRLMSYTGKALAAGDEYSKTILYKAQLKALATRKGLADGLDGDDLKRFIADASENPSEAMRADAVSFANYGTYTNELGQTGKNIQSIIGRNPALRFVVPFVRTPINIFKFTFDRTPIGWVTKNFREDLAAGGVRRQMALSKIGMGSSIIALGVDLSVNGHITGGGPSDNRRRAALRRTGWQPYSIKVDDTWYSYSRFEPISTVLGMSADMAEILSNYESYDIDAQNEVDELSTAIIASIGNQVVGKTFLSGIADLTEMLSDPKRYSAAYLRRYAGSIVPAGVAALERADDPTLNYTFNMIDQVKSRIPGISKDLPARLNVYGEKIKTFYPNEKDLVGATMERMASLFNPIYYSKEKGGSDLDKFMLRNGFYINMPSKTQSFDGIKIKLKDYPDIYHRLVELRAGIGLDSPIIESRYGGATLKEYLTDMVKGENLDSSIFFNDFTDAEEQQNYITKIVTDYQAAAKKQLLEEFPVLEQVIGQEKEKQLSRLGNRGADDFLNQPVNQ